MASHEEKCSSCSRTDCSARSRRPNEPQQQFEERRAIAQRLCSIPFKVVVLSGKGGVGKSTVAANLATALQEQDPPVGLLDLDLHGPSIPTLFGLQGSGLFMRNGLIEPAEASSGVRVMSIGFLTPNPTDAVIWRGPMKMGAIRQFLKDVDWDGCRWLVIDMPPGTGDEPLSLCQLLPDLTGAVIVTTPQEVALADVRRCIDFCRKLSLPVLGLVENMTRFICPHCGKATPIFGEGGGARLAEETRIPYLGGVPLDPRVAEFADKGRSLWESGADAVKDAFRDVLERLLAEARRRRDEQP